jgi:hypothetical protein
VCAPNAKTPPELNPKALISILLLTQNVKTNRKGFNVTEHNRCAPKAQAPNYTPDADQLFNALRSWADMEASASSPARVPPQPYNAPSAADAPSQAAFVKWGNWCHSSKQHKVNAGARARIGGRRERDRAGRLSIEISLPHFFPPPPPRRRLWRSASRTTSSGDGEGSADVQA